VSAIHSHPRSYSEISSGCVILGLFLLAKSIARAWTWAYLWQADHNLPPTFQDDYWIGLLTVVVAATLLPHLIYRLTPPKSGHWPWIVLTAAALILPVFALFAPWTEWPPALDDLRIELLQLLGLTVTSPP
jgi:hypothetical protein